MVTLLINTQEVRIKNQWSDLVLKDAIDLHTIASEQLPKKIQELYGLCVESSEKNEDKIKEILATITHEEQYEILPKFFGSLILRLSDISEDTLSRITSSQRTSIYNMYLVNLVCELLFYPEYELKYLESFVLNDVEYFLPEWTPGVGNVKIPFDDRTALEFTESADLEIAAAGLAGGKYQYAANIMAILTRPKVNGILEPYDQKTSLKRAEIFLDMPMETVFEVFFCCILQLIKLGKQGRIFSPNLKIQVVEADGTTDGMQVLSRLQKLARLVRLKKLKGQIFGTGLTH